MEYLEDRCLLASVSWDGGGDGTSWHDALNWSGNVLPGSSDDVVIDVDTEEITVIHSAGTSIVNSLLSTEALVLAGGTLAVTSIVQVDNTFTLCGGSTTST